MQELVSESLNVVGEELALTFEDIRSILERFSDGGAGPQSMERCLNLLHTANGVLRMTETYGASLLTEEMEETCQYLEKARRQGGGADEALEALSRAAVQLPAYVELIINGSHDVPLVLLPLLNDLRAARGQPLLSESTLLLLNLTANDDESRDEEPWDSSGEDIVALCKELRPRFQLALLGWLKGDHVRENLEKIGQVVERIKRSAGSRNVRQLWWIVTGIIEALLDGGLESNLSLKRLMGQVDREMKRLPAIGVDQYEAQPPTELANNFLYYIARATSQGERIKALRAAFDLSELMQGGERAESTRENLGAPGRKLLRTVSQAIRDDIARVKDVLDIYVRTGMEHVEELVPQIELLKKIGDTLGVLGLGELREIIQAKRQDLQAIIDAGENVEESVLMEMASALLSVEDHLEEGLFDTVKPVGQVGETDRDKDYEEVMQAVMRECIVNLARIKDAVAQLMDRQEDGAQLDAVPTHLHGIIAGLTILNKEVAVSIVEQIGEQINVFMQADRDSVGTHQFELLADAVVSLEYYMETVQAGRKEPVYMLDNARDCLKALRESERGSARPVDIEVSGMETTVQIPDYAPTVVAPGPDTAPVMSATDRSGVDPELLELFIEEAGEEIESIARHLPAWVQDETNQEALITVRRSFHTLKGSGRMVGAELIGEYCWSVEDLLNRLINRTLEPQPAINDFLQRAFEALPELLEQLESGEQPRADIEALMGEAASLAQPEEEIPPPAEEADEAGLETREEGAAEPVSEEVEEVSETVVSDVEDSGAGMDLVLLEILSKETGTHLAVINDFVDECRNGVPPFRVSEELYRACHTLHGSVTMANAEAAAAVTRPLNNLIRRAYDHDLPIEIPTVNACAEASDAIVQIIDYLSGETEALPDTAELQFRLHALDEELEALAVEAENQAEQTLPPVVETELADETPGIEEPPVFDAEIAEIFSEEAAEILEAVDSVLDSKTDGKLGDAALAELQRHLHTLKGGARMAGLMDIGDFSHDLETLLVRMSSGELGQDASRLNLLRASIDELHRTRDQIEQGILSRPAAAVRNEIAEALGASIGEQAEEPTAQIADAESPDFQVETEAEPALEVEPEQETEAEVEAEQEAEVEAEVEPEQDTEAEPTVEAEEMAAAEFQKPGEAAAVDQPPVIPSSEQLGRLARELEEPVKPGGGDLSTLIPGAQKEPSVRERREPARVDPTVLENLLNAAGEVSIFHSRLSQQLGQIQFNLEELSQTVIRLREQLRNLEMATEAQIIYQHQTEAGADEPFDPLSLERYSKIQQLSRALGETTSDVASIKDLLQNLTGDTEALLVQQARTAAELQDGLMRTRMVPFEQHTSRLSRLVRQMSAEHGKQAELVVQGSGEIDRQVLEKMVPALEHMIRNAVIHGIETPDERVAAGKPKVGQIRITLSREGSQVVMEIADDGRGMDIDSIRSKAVNLGLISDDAELTSEEIIQFVLRSGFSTADRLTHAAGRGVGMDVVASEITKLGGTLQIESEVNHGTRIIVYLPYTLAVTQALIVRVASELYAIPLQTIEGIIRLNREEFEQKRAEENPVIEYGGREYQLRHLGPYLGLSPAAIPEDQDRISLFLVQAGENSTALLTDEMLDSREIVVKPVGGQLASIRGISGATILGDGQIVVILDVGSLVRMTPWKPEEWEPTVESGIEEEPLALVVDDSITMRRVTQRLLERNNMRVITAKDGVEAVGILRDHRPDIILLDVEMPRMDGYEFASFVRNNSDTEEIPIIMITSRVSENHKARAIELGVNDYLGKPYQETALLEAVHQLLDVELA